MKNRSAARKYAKVLIRITRSDEELDMLESELSVFSSVLLSSPAIRTFFLKPVIGKQKKLKAFEIICAQAKISEPVARFLSILIEHDRMDQLDEIRAALKEMKDEKKNIVVVEVTTATTMDANLQRKLSSLLSSRTGKNIRLNTKVDPSILGGVITKVGSAIYDGGMKAQLLRMKGKILGE